MKRTDLENATMTMFDFDTLDRISLSEHIKKHNGLKLIIAYSPGRGKTKTIAALRKTISKELPSYIANKFVIHDDFMGGPEKILNIANNNKYVCIAANIDLDKDTEAFNLLNNWKNYIKYYKEETKQYCLCMGHGTWDDEANKIFLNGNSYYEIDNSLG